MVQRFFLKKDERLNKKIIIQRLFKEGKIIKAFPLRIFVLSHSEHVESSVQVLIAVPKKNFKSAVHRNLLKRRIREAYRLNKHELYDTLAVKDIQIALGIVYVGEKISDYWLIEKKIKQSLSEIMATLFE